MLAQQPPAPPPAEDVSVLLKVVRAPATTAAQRANLAGKTYSGAVIVRAVRLNPDGSALIDTEPVEERAPGARLVLVRFAARQDDPQLEQLRRDQVVKFRAVLVRVTDSERMWIADFDKLVLTTRPLAVQPRPLATREISGHTPQGGVYGAAASELALHQRHRAGRQRP